MKHAPPLPDDPDAWLAQVFNSAPVRNGGILRSSVQAVRDGPGMDRFVREVHHRGFRALENSGHIIVFCNRKPVEILRPVPGNGD